MGMATVETGDECLGTGTGWRLHLGEASFGLPTSHRSPLAVVPKRPLHLATLGHLEAVKRVAMRPEKAGHKIIPTAELASLGIEGLPPVLMVAMAELDIFASGGSGVRVDAFGWLGALGILDVVESIGLITGDARW